ncbi:methyl-accepting chemotaxis protein [Myxococcaceae bacterium GXIMD 01537]
MTLNFKTFKQKVLVLPAVAAVFLVAILVVSMVLGRGTSGVHERIGSGLAPAVEHSRGLEQRYATLHGAVEALAAGRAADQLDAVRAIGKSLGEAITEAAKNPVVPAGRGDAQKAAFDAYWSEAEKAMERGARRDAGAADALAQVQARGATLSGLLAQASNHDQEALQAAFGEVMSLHTTSQSVVLVLVLLCIAAMAVLSRWLAREVAGPLGKLTETTRRIASDGDLTLTIDVRGDDELAQLARSIQDLVQKLRDVPQHLKKLADELAESASKLTTANMEHIEFLTQQSRSLTEAGTTMAEIAQTSDVAATRAEMVMKVAAQADSFSASGQQSIEQSASGLQLIRERVGTLVGSISNLSEQAVHAGEITGSVKDLADQSNVLALNAAIEAARAGEEGRGFAVVAREMRALSGQSLQSTQRIGKILLEINQAIRQTVSIAEGDSEKMEENIEQVLSSASSLKEITTVVQESSQAARQIVASVTQQNAGIAQMTEVISQLSQMMGDVGNATMTAQEAVMQLNTSVGELQQLVGRFRV